MENEPKVEPEEDPSGFNRFFRNYGVNQNGIWTNMKRNVIPVQSVPPASPLINILPLNIEDQGAEDEAGDIGDSAATDIEIDENILHQISPPRTPHSVNRRFFTPDTERASSSNSRVPRRSRLRDSAVPFRRLDLNDNGSDNQMSSEADIFAAKALSHRLEEVDPHNLLYSNGFPFSNESSDDEPDDHDDHDYLIDEVDDIVASRRRKRERSYFSNRFLWESPADVVRVLQYYTPKNNTRNKLELREKEELTARSSTTRLSTQQGYPVVIFRNQLFRPKEQTSSNYVIAKCTFIGENRKQCPGSLHCSWETGECVLHRECPHSSRRDQIAVLLIDRKLTVLEKSGTSIERCTELAVTLADDYDISSDLLGKTESIARRINDRSYGRTGSAEFPPDYDWQSEKNVQCLSYDAANFRANETVTAIWKIKGADEWLNGSSKVLHLDGKFSEIPNGFSQIYVISTQNRDTGKIIPLLFALTTSSTRITYRDILKTAKEQGLNPEEVFSDSELAIIGAVSDIWPNANINLCWRHWKCSLKKKLIELIGVKQQRQAQFQLFLKALYSLSFAPLDKCVPWLAVLRSRTLTLHPRMDEYFDYLKRTYFADSAMFHRTLWNCKRRASLGLEFTNNPSESIFAKYKRLFEHNAYRQMNRVIRKTAQWVETLYKDELSGRNNHSKKKKYRLYKDADFSAVTQTQFIGFDAFEKAISPWMKVPSIYH